MALMSWGSWMPDVSSFKGTHSPAINNVLPRGDGYGPIRALSGFSDAMGAVCRGAFLAIKTDGTYLIFAGTATGLFLMSNSDLSWEDVSRTAGGAYSVASSAQWSFAQFGSVVVAVNGADAVQAYTIGSSTDFAALAGSPPIATYVTTVGPFVVLSGLTAAPYRIAWSARDDATGWTAGTNGSDIQDFYDGGVVRGVAGGEFGWTFQDGCIRRMTFVGGETGFEFDKLTDGKGLKTPYSLIRASDMVFFLSSSGFEQLMPTGQIISIGKEKFDRYFYADWDGGSPQLMCGTLDPETTRVWWFYKSTSGAAGLFNKAIVYDWALQRASPVSGVGGEFAASLGQPAITLDSLDTLGYSDLDAIPFSLDDVPVGLGQELGVFSSTHVMGFLSGDNLEATLETLRSALDDNKRVFVRGCRPDTDATSVFGSVIASQRLATTETASSESAMNAIGFTPHRIDTRIAAFRNRIPAATVWTFSVGVEPEMAFTGVR